MNVVTGKKCCWLIVGALVASSCAQTLRHPDSTGVEIERVWSSSGTIKSADFASDQHGLHLHGQVSGNPISRGPLSGHVDIAVMPESGATLCFTTRPAPHGHQMHKPFSLLFDEMPEAGTVISNWHHDGDMHDGCID